MNQITRLFSQASVNLRRRPGYVLTVSSIMGIALGALLCVLNIIYTVLVSPLPYPDQENIFIANIQSVNGSGVKNEFYFSYPGAMQIYNDNNYTKSTGLALYEKAVLASHASQPTINTTYVTPEYFKYFSPQLIAGRTFNENEKPGDFIPGAVISYDIWRDKFNGDKNVIGKPIVIMDKSFPILGIAAKEFVEPTIYRRGHRTAIWLTWDHNPIDPDGQKLWEDVYESLVVLVRPNDAISKTADMTFFSRYLNESWQEGVRHLPFYKNWSVEIGIESLQSRILGDFSQTAFVLLVATLGLALIATANIANLFISRTAEQQRTLAISAALGAKKKHLFIQMLSESSTLMSVSTLIAIALTAVGFNITRHYMSEVFPRSGELSVTAVTVLIALLCTTVFSLIFAALSTGIIKYRHLTQALQSSGKGTGIQVSKRLRNGLIVCQIAVTFLLVLANGNLLVHSVSIINTPANIDTDNIIDVSLTLARNPVQDDFDGPPLGEAILKSLSNLPQVIEASGSMSPFSGFTPVELTDANSNSHFTLKSKYIDSTYFSMLKQKTNEGRLFERTDILDGNPVVVVNSVFAKRLSPSGSAIGSKLITEQNDTLTVVGVVEAMVMPGEQYAVERVYLPGSIHSIEMMLKLAPGQTLSQDNILSTVQEVTSLFALFSINSAGKLKNDLLFPQYITAALSASVTLLSFTLAAIGLYGILNYSLQMRRVEIGTRIAIGAKPNKLIRMVFNEMKQSMIYGVVFAVTLIMIVCATFFDSNSEYLGLHTLYLGIFTFVSITIICALASYIPLKGIIRTSAIKLLRGQ